jgi:DNA-binding response OmpR family regulator/class 3 adenylate cyclase/predicted ATPase
MEACVLVISDDVAERATIARALQSAGRPVELAEGAKRALKLAERGKFEAAIVAMSAQATGEAIVRELRGIVPRVIALVDPAQRRVRSDRALLRADAILVRPLDRRQLLLALSALKEPSQGSNTIGSPPAVAFEGCTFDVAGRTFVDRAGREIPLTRSEAALLAILVSNPMRVMSRDKLRRAIAGRGAEAYDRSVDILVGRLRRKIEPDPSKPRVILTISGSGYKFVGSAQSLEPSSPVEEATRATEPRTSFHSQPTSEGPGLAGPRGPAVSEFLSEKRQVTVLSCGLANVAALLAKGDLEEIGDAIGVFHDTAARAVAHMGGSIARSAGEEIVALFGYPEVHEDDAERAVQAALDLVAGFAEFRSPAGASFPVQAVIATGTVLADRTRGIIGAPLALATRLRTTAPMNAPVISDCTCKIVWRVFDLEDPTAHELEDLPEPAMTYRVTGRRSAPTRFESMHGGRLTPFVGRRKELEQLESLWERAKLGQGQVALICGEPGIGKSRTFKALLDVIASDRYSIICCQCSPHHANSPYYPIIRYLEGAAGFNLKDSPAQKLEKLSKVLSIADSASTVSSLDIALCAALLSIPTSQVRLPADLTPQRQKDLTNSALIRHVLSVARRQPLILKLADSHWADPSTLELFGAIVASISAARVFLIVTCRAEFVTAWPAHSHVSMLRLDRLEREFARDMVGLVAEGALPDRVCEQIVTKTDGVPLFVEELTKAIVEFQLSRAAAGLDPGPGSLVPAMPETLAESLAARLHEVGDSKRIAQIGSAIGREFSYRLLATVAQAAPPSLRSALAQLEAHELIFVRGEPPNSSYIFKHALVQDAAYATLPRSERRRLHSLIARTLEKEFSETITSQPEIIAHHLTQAGQFERAVGYFRRAAQRAIEQSANLEAVSHLTNAVRLLQSLPESEDNRRAALGLETMVAQAMIAMYGYAAPQTRDALRRARVLASDSAGHAEEFVILYGLWAASYVGGSFAEQGSAADEFLAEAQRQGDAAALCIAHRVVGTTLLNRGEVTASLPHLNKARALYDPERDAVLRHRYGQDIGAAALCYLSWALWRLGCADQAEALAGEAVRLATELAHPHTLVYTLAHAHGFMGIFRRGGDLDSCANAMRSLCAEHGFSHWINFARILRGWAGVCRGEFDGGIDELLAGIAGWRGTGSRLWLPMFHVLAAQAYAAACDPDAAAQAIEQSFLASKETGENWALAEALRVKALTLSQARRAGASDIEALLKTSLDVAGRQRARFFELRAACDLARLWRSQDKIHEALTLLRCTYSGFTEGFATNDLADARSLILDLELAAAL